MFLNVEYGNTHTKKMQVSKQNYKDCVRHISTHSVIGNNCTSALTSLLMTTPQLVVVELVISNEVKALVQLLPITLWVEMCRLFKFTTKDVRALNVGFTVQPSLVLHKM